MRLLFSFSQKLFLFFPAQPLDGIFPLQGSGFIGHFLLIDQLKRTSSPSVFGSLTRAVDLQATGHIVGDSGIKTAVPAAQHIDKPGHRSHLKFKNTDAIVTHFFPGGKSRSYCLYRNMVLQ